MNWKMVSSGWIEECRFVVPEVDSEGGWLWQWVAPFLLTPCLEHCIVSASSAILCLIILISFIVSGKRPRVDKNYHPRASVYYWTTLTLTSVVAVILFAWAAWEVFATGVFDAEQLSLLLLQSVTWLLFFVAVLRERYNSVEIHWPSLRITWILNFLLSSFILCSAALRLAVAEKPVTAVNDLVAVITCSASLFLLAAAFMGKTGISSSSMVDSQNGHLTEALLGTVDGDFIPGETDGERKKKVLISDYDKAGIISKLVFLWMNPVLKVGSKKVLAVEDVPRLGRNEDVETAYGKFKREWDREGQSNKLLPWIIIRAHWRMFAFTGFLGLLKLVVMYTGPLLIQRFIDVTADENSRWSDGASLVGLLLFAKAIEVICDHQSNFIGRSIAIAVWSGLVSSVYRKGLKITSSARQSHGTGKIVNYMSVDAETVSQVFQQLHDLWGLPLQICLALLILYTEVGVATFAGIGTMLVIMLICLVMASFQQKFQTKIMETKDKRIRITTEALGCMKIIKLCAWQEEFLARVEAARGVEREWIGKIMYLAAMNIFFLWLSPLAVSVITFGTCVLLGVPLTAGKVFTAIATFRIVQEPLRSFPQIVMAAAQAMVSVRRLKTYLESPELDVNAVSRLPSGETCAVVVENGVFKWEPEAESPTLKNIDIQVRSGSLAAIVGTVGSGKSALLSCLLGEMEKVSGNVALSGTVAYVAQSAWIQNGTVKDNILFGKAFDESSYKETLRVCALASDLAQMQDGDQTEIGEKGINLSGGQKQRVQLARAVYQDADIYLLDDIFSALDAHTGSSIFQDCVRGFLSRKTVLLVTHQVEFLHGADLILVMRDGEIVQSGKYNELTSQGTDFGALVDAHNESLETGDSNGEDRVEDETDDVIFELGEEENFATSLGQLEPHLPTSTAPILIARSPSSNPASEASTPPSVGSGRLERGQSLERKLEHSNSRKFNKAGGRSGKKSLQKSTSTKTRHPPAAAPAIASAKLIETEEREKGHVNSAVYWAYCTKVFYGMHTIALIFIQICWQGLQIASDFWLADSTSEESVENFNAKRFMTVYAGLAIGSGMFVLARSLLVSFSGLKTAQRFFLDMVRSVFRAPMSFFDTTPTGRVLTRSSTDQVDVDFYIPFMYGSILAVGFQLIGVLTVMSRVTWQLLFLIIPLAIVFVQYQRYFIATSRELTRLESITQAPIIQHFSETISGFTTVRAFGHQERFVTNNVELCSVNMGIQYHSNGAFEWLGFRLESIGAFLLCISALILVLVPKGMIQPEFVGLSLSYGLALNGCLFWLIIGVSMLEQKMVAVERILQYTGIPSEAPLVIEGHRPDATWPNKGSITMKNVQMRYRPDTPLVLKGISFSLRGGEKLGVVGRTGSGKSSLIQALFRIVEPAGGQIVVDRIDITTIGLRDLRSKFSIIPQEPTLFEGNVRNNVDPLGKYSDAEVWEALEKSQLKDVVWEKDTKLDYLVAENGDNWSMGQRQLFCLARALLRKSKVLVLDEATASVDTQTDIVLQKIITREFADCTVISIAHRIPSVMDSDKVLVLDAGVVKEFGSPTTLLDQQGSFSALVQEYWNRSNSLTDLAAPGFINRNL
ncbi:unnamed protein product [Calypogeia fissa]